MNIGKINSQNFTSQYTDTAVSSRPYEDNSDVSNNSETEGRKFFVIPEEKLQSFNNRVAEIKQNIRPVTVVTGCLVIGAAFTKGKNIVPVVRRALVKVGSGIAKGVAKVAHTVAEGATKLVNAAGKKIKGEKFSAKQNPLNYDKMTESIKKTASVLRDEPACYNEKFVNGVHNLVEEISGDKNTADKVKKFMVNNRIVNGVRVSDAAAAVGVGLITSDSITDAVENIADEQEIKKLQEKLINGEDAFEI